MPGGHCRYLPKQRRAAYRGGMDNRSEVRDFLMSRRARITPEQAGLAPDSTVRRVAGLRRREAADLAGISIEYYVRLERGNLRGVSQAVLDAVARSLDLDEAERAHLNDLARAQGPARRQAARLPKRQPIRPEVQATLDGFTTGPAFVRNGRMDILATNHLGRAVYAQAFEDAVSPPNLARYVFLDPRARDFYADWDRSAHDNVAILRTHAGRHPDDQALIALVGLLSTRSDEFAQLWAGHDVRIHYTGRKHFHHPVVGDLQMTYQELDLFAEQGLSMLIYTPQPDTGTREALQLLASWTTTPDPRRRQAETEPHRAEPG